MHLALTDPDSSQVVPHSARFAGDFMLTSQGDLGQIFLSRHHDRGLSVLRLSQSIDDSVWATAGTGACTPPTAPATPSTW